MIAYIVGAHEVPGNTRQSGALYCRGIALFMAFRKGWQQLWRERVDVARCTIARLMRAMDLAGVIGGRPMHNTISDRSAPAINGLPQAARVQPGAVWLRSRVMMAEKSSAPAPLLTSS